MLDTPDHDTAEGAAVSSPDAAARPSPAALADLIRVAIRDGHGLFITSLQRPMIVGDAHHAGH